MSPSFNYLSLKDAIWDKNTDIFTDIFNESVLKINKGPESDAADRLLEEVMLTLDNNDL